MKITCQYCGALFNDTKTHCPSCGAPNPAVVRTGKGQPITIEELKKWYHDRGLPPYETTRFFIGENYKKPRAFGIYKDGKTGNIVVYKNKDNGKRTIRYEGTDEAYAVNEIYQRLKQEIIQQKRLSVEKREAQTKAQTETFRTKILKFLSGCFTSVINGCLLWLRVMIRYIAVLIAAMIAIVAVLFFVLDTPIDGYYRYEDTLYYYYSDYHEGEGESEWFFYDVQNGKWSDALAKEEVPEELKKDKSARKYYLQKETPADAQNNSFYDTDIYKDTYAGSLKEGYYSYEGDTYYYLDFDASDDSGSSANFSNWYIFDISEDLWKRASTVPESFEHSASAEDFYFTPTWDAGTQFSDFTDTEFYSEYEEYQSQQENWDNDNDDSSFNWDSRDSWDAGGMDWDSDW